MSWLFSQALVEEYLEENFWDGEPSAPLNGNPIPQAYCAPDKMTGFSRLSRFGMTFKPLTESRGKELLTLYLAGFPARTLVLRGGGQALLEAEVPCGNTWQGLLGRYDPSTHSLKTAQCSLFEDLKPSSVTLPRWGSMQNGELYQRQTLVRPILESEFGLWLTPSTVDIGKRSEDSMKRRLEYRKNIGRNGVGAGYLSEQVTWSGTGPPIGYMTAERLFPTPAARDYKGARKPETMALTGRNPETNSLPDAVEFKGQDGRLNPPWVEKLMGWPDEWTCLNPISHVKICFWLMGFCDGEENRTTEVLRVLRRGYAAQEVREAIGRFVGVSEAAILLAKLCEHAHRFDEAWLFMACAKALEEEMRGVRLCESITSASYRPKQDLQQTREYPDTMQALSRLLAHYGETAWKDGSWEDAVPRVANGVAARMDRLKAIGNGQVPRVAATAWGLLK